MYDGQIHTVTELLPMASGTDVVLTSTTSSVRVSLMTLLDGSRARLIPSGDGSDLTDDPYSAAAIRARLAKYKAARTRRCSDCNGEIHTECRCSGTYLAFQDEPRRRNAVTEPSPKSTRKVSTDPNNTPYGPQHIHDGGNT